MATNLTPSERSAVEADFIRLYEKTLAAHTMYVGGLIESAHEYLLAAHGLSKGLLATIAPCSHVWVLNGRDLTCTECGV